MAMTVVMTQASSRRAADKTRSSSTVKTEQRAVSRDIRRTNKAIDDNRRRTEQQLDRLGVIRADIDRQSARIAAIEQTVGTIDREISLVNDTIGALTGRQQALRASYVRALRDMQGRRRSMGTLAFVLSSGSFTEATRRVRYIRQFARFRRSHSERLARVADELASRRESLASMQRERSSTLAELGAVRAGMKSNEAETASLVDKLQQQGSALRETLRQHEARSRELDSELSRVIAADRERRKAEKKKAAEQRQTASRGKAASPAPSRSPSRTPSKAPAPAVQSAPEFSPVETGSFASAKGRLPYPVAGSYRLVQGFGRQPHPDLPNVYTNNPGIDLEVTPGAQVKAVYQGKVTAIFQQPGYNWIVMVRHGDYLTIYGNIASPRVKSGQSVSAGTVLGSVYVDQSKGGRSIFHFEVRHEREKLNPRSWLR